MPRYDYTGIDDYGKSHKDQMEAESEKDLEKKLAEKGYYLLEAKEVQVIKVVPIETKQTAKPSKNWKTRVRIAVYVPLGLLTVGILVPAIFIVFQTESPKSQKSDAIIINPSAKVEPKKIEKVTTNPPTPPKDYTPEFSAILQASGASIFVGDIKQITDLTMYTIMTSNYEALSYRDRLLLARRLLQAWRNIRGDNLARICLYDSTGNEIGGTSIFSGDIWVEQ